MTVHEKSDPLDLAGIGRCPAFLAVVEQARELARIPRPILIRGERGTGKELLARFVHAASPRHAGPYLIVNCGAFQDELLVSHLFGHEKGAFTGATERRVGVFEQANGGTLFLDEVANLSRNAQARLHRVVEYQTFERVGGIERDRGRRPRDRRHERGPGRADRAGRLHGRPLRSPALRGDRPAAAAGATGGRAPPHRPLHRAAPRGAARPGRGALHRGGGRRSSPPIPGRATCASSRT